MKTIPGFLLVAALTLLAGCSDRLAGSRTDSPEFEATGFEEKWPSTVIAVGSFDTSPAWPLCGRISEAPPAGWTPEMGCPSIRFGNPEQNDFPLSSTFGPRQKASQSFRYDYHRGIDIPTPIGTPLFAIADGTVNKAGDDPGYDDPLIQLRHRRPGQPGCGTKGCYFSNYLHVSEWVVTEGQNVTKGQLIGFSGASGDSGFPHLHFEIRNAPGSHDADSNWSRDAIHPLSVLPYPDSRASNVFVSIDAVDTSIPGQPDVTVSVSIPNSIELDLQGIDVSVFRSMGDGSYSRVAQVGDAVVGTTPEGSGYVVNPSSFDMVLWNRQYSYKNSAKIPYSVFQSGGVFESPYAAELPPTYDAQFHLDHPLAGFPRIGQFNGAEIAPAAFNALSAEYGLTVTFRELKGPVDPSLLCIRARARDARGSETEWVGFNCAGF